jgi:cytoskeletal protein CcmA (bactofilin family)
MTFDMVFMLRDRAPALFEFTIVLGALVSAASILTFLASALVRRVVGPIALLGFVCASLFASPQAASALERRTGEGDMRVGAGETVEESLFISGETVTVDGTIDGDLAAFGERVVLRGVVRGNVITVGREVEILGTIEGSLHSAGERVTIEGKVHQNVYGGAETLTLHERGNVGRDAVLLGESVHVDGRIGRDLFSAAKRVEIRGSVGRNASTRSERLTLHESADITGNLHYELAEGDEPEIASGARIGAETTSGILMHRVPGAKNRWLDGHFYMRAAVFLVSAFLVGMLLHLLIPSLFLADLETSSDFFRSLGYGAIALIGTPIAIVLCCITVVGIPIGVIGVFLYLTTLFVSVIVVASLVGTSISATMGFEPEDAHGFGVSLLVGLVLVLVGMNLPFVGGLLRLLAVVIGLGMLIDAVMSAWRVTTTRSPTSPR